jgi:beta-galactosidase/beta-glucuronidase
MKKMLFFIISTFLLIQCTVPEEGQQVLVEPEWKPAENPLFTRWAENVSPENVHQEYPRPTKVRDQWMNLNGLWNYAITPESVQLPDVFEGEILVPFPIESALSGVKRPVQPDEKLWYQRYFSVPDDWDAGKLLLHFGAVDWHAKVYVNGQMLAEHKGGYDPFTLDISPALNAEPDQMLVVEVMDPTDEGKQPTGKQTLNPRGIWYTPTTGIWRTVWLEPVPETYINTIKITPDIDQSLLYLEVETNQPRTGWTVKADAMDNGSEVATTTDKPNMRIALPISNPKLWSPSAPNLYDLSIQLINENQEVVDEVSSYFGMRKVSVAKGPDGYNRIFLNNEPLFQLGPLDQGFWPDGLYTAASDEALKYDVQVTKEMGFNMARKHVKVEPERWYYWCDKLGLLVWQDMPSGEERIGPDDDEINRSPESAEQFETELQELIDDYYNHPSIIMWVIFNEGWGQYQTAEISQWAQNYDTTRLINPASGWLDVGNNVGDVMDIHSYPGPAMPEVEQIRVAVLGEFGGQALPMPEHMWVQNLENAPTHFETSKTSEDLQAEYKGLYLKLYPLIDKGLAAAVYTQTTDVEAEVNGLLTYDREVIKIDVDTLKAIHQETYRRME